jgi:hypothetical protein
LSDTPLQSIVFRPGINQNVTEYLAEGGWVDGDKIRFNDGRAQKIGGWARQPARQNEDLNVSTFTGVPRDILAWTSLTSLQYLLVASNKKLELVLNNKIYDVTPTRIEKRLLAPATTDDDSRYREILTDAISTTSGLSTVEITDVEPHNLEVGDFVFVNSQQTAVDGILLSGTYQVTVLTDSFTFQIDSGIAATGTTALAGGQLYIDYLLECGLQSNSELTGYGGGTWNTPGASGQGYNRPRSGGEFGALMRQWTLDNWGEDFIACVSYGEIYHWDASLTGPQLRRSQTLENRLKDPTSDFYEPDPVLRQEKVDAIPTTNLFTLVALPSRIVIAFGSELAAGPNAGDFDPLIIRWSDIESLTDWRITETNSAGEFRLPKGNRIVAAYQTRNEIIISTDTELYSMTFVGGNDVFNFRPLGSNNGAAGVHSMIDVNGIVMFMGVDDFYMYDGTIRPIPNSLDDYIYDQDGEGRLDVNQKEKIFAGVNKKFHEVWWFYPKEGTDPTNEDINNYVVFNYLENVWYYGTLPRSVWVDRGTFSTPFSLGIDRTLYSHENGKDDDGAPMRAFIRSGYFDLGEGLDFMFVDRILPDLELPNSSTCKITIFTKRYPHPNARIITKGPYIFSDDDNKISMRARGRAMSIQYEVDGAGEDFEIGKVRVGIQPDGHR